MLGFGCHLRGGNSASDGDFVVDAKGAGELVGGHPNHYAYRVGPTMPCGGPPIPSPDRLLAIDSSSCPDDETSSMARSVCRLQARKELESPDFTRERSGDSSLKWTSQCHHGTIHEHDSGFSPSHRRSPELGPRTQVLHKLGMASLEGTKLSVRSPTSRESNGVDGQGEDRDNKSRGGTRETPRKEESRLPTQGTSGNGDLDILMDAKTPCTKSLRTKVQEMAEEGPYLGTGDESFVEDCSDNGSDTAGSDDD